MKLLILARLLLPVVISGWAFAQEEPEADEVQFAALWLSNTSQASSDEHILIAAMLAEQYQKQLTPDFLSMEISGTDLVKLRYSLIAYHCLVGAGSSICADDVFERRLIALDPGNMEPQLYLMLKSLRIGNNDTALAALVNANKASLLNNYYFEKLFFLRKQLSRAGYPEELLNSAAESLAGASPMYAIYSQMHSSCTERSLKSAKWKDQCLKLGQRLEKQGKTAMQNIFGFAIQRDSLGVSDTDAKERQAVLERRAAFNDIRDKASEELAWWGSPELKTDELYQNMAILGEILVVQNELLDLESRESE